MAELIQYDITQNHIAIVTLNRPNQMNALSSPLLIELNAKLTEIENNDAIRAIIITGAGEKAFCAGADLKERRGMNDHETIEAVKRIGETVNKVSSLSVPVIAAINGAAFGGGLELALACDIRIGARHAQVGLTETSLAIIPGAGGTQRLARLIGTGHAKKMIFTAQAISADEAYRLGIVESMTTQEALVPEALTMAKRIAQNGPIAMKQAKAAIDHGIEVDLHTSLDMEHMYYQQTIPTEDRLEGLNAFKEKRQPKYKGR